VRDGVGGGDDDAEVDRVEHGLLQAPHGLRGDAELALIVEEFFALCSPRLANS
jgi:hypothetical protein